MTVNSFVGLSACDPESGFNDTTVFLCETEFSRSTRPGPPLTARGPPARRAVLEALGLSAAARDGWSG